MSRSEIGKLTNYFQSKLTISNEHAFLVDPDTIEFIKNSKVIFINRGLPGSGKSTLSNKIKKVYPNTVICAGDDYFTDQSGNYNFDRDKLHEAHLSAQNKAIDACQNEISPIVVDNTNIKYWELKPYIDIGRKFNYLILIIEPRTAHKFDVEKLCLLNKHNVPRQIIKRKLAEFQIIAPIYFAWFLNEKDSLWLDEMAKNCLSQVFDKCDLFKNDLMDVNLSIDLEKKFEYKNKRQLHCTAKFLGKNWANKSNLKEYVTDPWITQNLGKVFELELIGFSITKRSIAADVCLKREHIGKLWGNDLNQHEQLEVLEYLKKDNYNSVIDKTEFAHRAHITIGVGSGEKSYKAGIDLVIIKLMKINNELNGKEMQMVKTNNFEIIHINRSLCYCKLNNSIKLKALFSGEY